MLNSNQLLQFKVVAEQESITKASAILFISQPALSKTIGKLESELGCPLFDRTGRQLRLNDAGRKLLGYAQRLDSLLEEAEGSFKQREDSALSLCSVGNFFPFVLSEYFKEGVRPIKLNIVADFEVPERLRSGDVDAAIADSLYLGEAGLENMRQIPILYEKLLLSVPADHELAQEKTVKITDLKDVPILRSTSSEETNNWLEKILEFNNTILQWAYTMDGETWRYYMRNMSNEMPPFFDTSGSFLAPSDSRETRTLENRSLVTVTGRYTERMISIWFLRNREQKLSEFLESLKNLYC